MAIGLTRSDRLGLLKPAIDAHTLGINAVKQLLESCSFQCLTADAETDEALATLDDERSAALIEQWVRRERITALGFSYRLDARDGASLFGKLLRRLEDRHLLSRQGGPVRGVYFAGLPQACDLVRRENPEVAGTFCGDETPTETLRVFSIPPSVLPRVVAEGIAYDEDRLAFGRELIKEGEYLGVGPVDRSGYEGFGTRPDTLVRRLRHGEANGLPPLMRAHVGPYLPDRSEAVELFLEWTRGLAGSGLLDILSIGTSQLTQSDFGEDWGDRPNGGGVPLNSAAEFAMVWEAARPMLVRTYAGTRNIPALAKMYEETINIAWHALSMWWFCQIDGRGPYSVRENLDQHIETLRHIAQAGKPFEPNVSHHFGFRGADDVTCIVAAVLAARTAKCLGVRHLVLQNMLNTPKTTWGVQDLAKSRALLHLVRQLEDDHFHVILQPRGGLDYFSHDLEKAKAQVAAVSALMDDIEPGNAASPPVVHVVSYCEGSHLADPQAVDESIRITRHAIERYRALRAKGQIDDMSRHPETRARTARLLTEARMVLSAIEVVIPNPYTAKGLYEILASGFLSAPYLWGCTDEFEAAMKWQTRTVDGSVKVVDPQGKPIPVADRMGEVIIHCLAAIHRAPHEYGRASS